MKAVDPNADVLATLCVRFRPTNSMPRVFLFRSQVSSTAMQKMLNFSTDFTLQALQVPAWLTAAIPYG